MRFTRLFLVAVAVLAVLAASAFAATSRGTAVHVGSSKLGRILVNGQGRTLYIWAHDKGSKSTCYGMCAQYWPPVYTSGKPRALRGVRSSLLGTTRRKDGRKQVTYNGHPLYLFVMDKAPGQVKGEGLTGFGGRWDPVAASGRAVTANSAYMKKPYATPGYSAARKSSAKPVKVSVITPQPGDIAGAGGVFSIDLSLQAQNARGNRLLSAANGYQPFFNNVTDPTFGPGKIDPGAPGLVVTLSNTPAAAGGPQANLAGVFQLNAVVRHKGKIQTFNDWQVGSPGFFGRNVQSTLTAYVVAGTAPGVVPAGGLTPISNVVRQTFTVAG
jgi:predicted lipoprotein with Yx(FWY)xxD motif